MPSPNPNSSCMLFSNGFPRFFCLIDIVFQLSQAWHWLRNSSIERAFSVCAWTQPHLHRVFTTFNHFMSKVIKSPTSKNKHVKSHLFNAKRKVRSSDFQTSKAAHCFCLCLCSIFQNTIETSLKACLFFQSLYQHCSRNIEPDMDVIRICLYCISRHTKKIKERHRYLPMHWPTQSNLNPAILYGAEISKSFHFETVSTHVQLAESSAVPVCGCPP